MNLLRNRKLRLFAALVAGLFLLYGGFKLSVWSDPQSYYYNQGLKLYANQQDPLKAAQLFDRSMAAYREAGNQDWIHRFLYPEPNTELAALAQFQKAKALLRAQKAKEAVEAFETSLVLNPGNGYPSTVSKTDAERMHEEAMVVKYDLEQLFKSQPQLAKQQGKGKGKGQGNQPQRVPGQNPQNGAGKGNPNKI